MQITTAFYTDRTMLDDNIIMDNESKTVLKEKVGFYFETIKPTQSIVHGDLLNEHKFRVENLQVAEGEE